MIIASLVPCLPIAKADVVDWPVVGELARRYGAMFVQHGSPASSYRVLRSALAHLKEGGTIVNFPEGDTSEGHVGRFRRGIFGLAELAGVRVVPVAIAMGKSLMRRPEQSAVAHYVAAMKDGPHDVFVRFGKALPAAPDAKLLARLGRARIQLMLEELRAANGLSGLVGRTRQELSPKNLYVG
jgi:1-acyl-sn-glycerol-3-phosphate acyltransferase